MVVLVRVTVLVLLEVDAAIRTLISVMVVLVRVTVLVLLEVDAAPPPLEDVLEDVVVDEPPPDAPDVVVDQPPDSPPPPEDVDVDQPDDDALKLAQGSSGSLCAATVLPRTGWTALTSASPAPERRRRQRAPDDSPPLAVSCVAASPGTAARPRRKRTANGRRAPSR